MFDVGWTEMLVIAVVMIVVVGPKDLPNMLRTFGRMTAKMRGMAADFRKQFDDALKEAELDDVKKSVDQLRSLNPMTEVRKQLNPFEKAAADLRAGVDNAMKPKPAPEPTVEAADAPAIPAEPLKNGATDMPSSPAGTGASAVASASPSTASSAKPAGRKKASKPAKASSSATAKSAAARKAPAAKAVVKTAGAAGKSVSASAEVKSKKAVGPSAKTTAKVAAKPAKPGSVAKSAKSAKPVAATKTARGK
jgi:sec-independent protein translocase protein TatB